MSARTLTILLLCILPAIFAAQPKNFTQIEDADEHFEYGNYIFAIPAYKNELKKTPDDIRIKYKLGICYINTRLSREEAIMYLEEASRNPKTDGEVWFFLGRAYQLNNRIHDAVAAFDKFRVLKPKLAAEADRHLEQCRNALEFMQKPTDVTLQNLGKHVNSEEPDYNPFTDRHEMFLVFTSRRLENIGGKKIEVDGYRSSDIYQCRMENGNWSAAANAGRGVNTKLDEQVVGLSPEGMEMYMYIDHIDKYGNIYTTTRADAGTDFGRPKMLDETVNEKIETSGCISEDGNVLFFARREHVEATSDLYISRRLPNGKWGLPVRLPESVNTPYNEDCPFLSFDGKTLYFSSDGHKSMGGYDLFRSSWNPENDSFSPPQNLGFPINSTDDDKSICVTSDNRLAYISAFRPNGYGDLDIYRVKFNQAEPVIAIYAGRVFMGDTAAAAQPGRYAVDIIVTDKASGYEYTFIPHSVTGRYVMALPAGEYELSATAKGYVKYIENLSVTDMGMKNHPREKDLHFKKDPGTPKKTVKPKP